MIETVPKAVQDCHDLLRWLIPHLDKFPRARRFTLGERLEAGLLGVLAELVDAAYRRDKTPALRRANQRLQAVRHLRRLCWEPLMVRKPAPAVAQGTSGSFERLSGIDPPGFVSNARTENQQVTVVPCKLEVVPVRRYEHGARLLESLGAQVGGRLRARERAA